MIINLTEMKTGESGVVLDIEGGMGATARIKNMGIRIGKKVKKISHFHKGPQTVLVDNFKVAIGYGRAEKIMVEVKD